ncbi:hypothetical protein BDM02DRAFT_3114035 [Thelephora ganbajun]|uniref:Uncharacterized protein n=1 Tax=Thelephora ganbajun TaxID=370292 RepID=A0ACB6ZIC0_THEGA|nr:hypothetical protein BDM02DRAFT_3114035 [Thelephora ganbajun]
MKLDMQIEAILKPKKGNRMKRKKKDADEELDRYADEEVSRLREAMLAAAADDDQSNKQKLPASTGIFPTCRCEQLFQSIISPIHHRQ